MNRTVLDLWVGFFVAIGIAALVIAALIAVFLWWSPTA